MLLCAGVLRSCGQAVGKMLGRLSCAASCGVCLRPRTWKACCSTLQLPWIPRRQAEAQAAQSSVATKMSADVALQCLGEARQMPHCLGV